MSDDARPSSFRVSRAQRIAEQRVFNPLFRWLLRSRFHWVASRWLVLVSYVGRRTGRRYRFPAVYALHGDRVVVVTPTGESTWWRNFEDSRECTLWYRGRERQATGEVTTGDERKVLLTAYFEAHSLLGRVLGVSVGRQPLSERFEGLAVVQFHVH